MMRKTLIRLIYISLAFFIFQTASAEVTVKFAPSLKAGADACDQIEGHWLGDITVKEKTGLGNITCKYAGDMVIMGTHTFVAQANSKKTKGSFVCPDGGYTTYHGTCDNGVAVMHVSGADLTSTTDGQNIEFKGKVTKPMNGDVTIKGHKVSS